MPAIAGKDDPVAKSTKTAPVVGGVDPHKDLHVAAVVDDSDRVLGTQSFATIESRSDRWHVVTSNCTMKVPTLTT